MGPPISSGFERVNAQSLGLLIEAACNFLAVSNILCCGVLICNRKQSFVLGNPACRNKTYAFGKTQ